MSYIINNSRGDQIAIIPDGTVNTTATDLALVGRAVIEYGVYENENYVYLLENFCNSSPPTQPILGQLWYNNAEDILSVYGSANVFIDLASIAYVEAQKISPVFTGTPTAPTAASGTATTQLATTAFVTNSPAFAGTPTAPTAASGTATTQLATTAFVTNGPAFAVSPTGPTPVYTAADNKMATTEFVQAQKASPVFTGTPQSPTAASIDSSTQIATTEFVQAQKASPVFTGTPAAPTPDITVSNTQIATTRFVTNWTNALPTMSQQNANAVAITGGTITGITPLAVAYGGTGGSSQAGGRTGLGLGTISTQDANNVAISAKNTAIIVI